VKPVERRALRFVVRLGAMFAPVKPRGASLIAVSLVVACGAAPREPPVLPPPAPPEPMVMTPMQVTGVAPAAQATEYSGHGVASLPAAVLEKYRPKPLSPDVSRRIQAFIDVAGPGVGALSPDGKRLFFNWSVTGVTQLWRLDGKMRFPSQLTGGEDRTWLSAITNDNKRLVVARDRKGEENPGLYLQSPDGGALTLVQHLPGVQTLFGGVSRDSKSLYFSSNDLKKDAYAVYRWDLEKNVRERVVADDGLWRIADLHDDGRLLLQKMTGAQSSEIWEWDPKTKKLSPLFGQNEKEEYRPAYGGKPGEILVLTNKLGDFRRLYRWEKSTLTPLSPELAFDVSGYSIDERRRKILYTLNENGFTRLFALDARSYKPIALPALPAADHVLPGSTTPDGRFTTLGIDDGKSPLQAYVLDWQARRIEKWHAPSTPEIDSTRFARAELDFYPARDGTKIPVFVRRPAKCAADPCPVIVSFHGGPEAQTRPGFSVNSQMFVDAGFVLAEPNVRGSDGYGKTWLRADDGAKRLAIITDIEDAAKWAKQKFASGGKPPKLGVYGGSYGGYSVLMAMTMFAGAYDAGVNVVGISNLKTFLLNTAPYRRILRISEYGDPEKDADALAKLSPITYVDRARAPLLILQGATDPRVPAGEAVQIHEAFQKKGIASELMIFADEGHGAQKRENRVLMLGHAVAFFEKHLVAR
jgi:prolyl oligopeptidase PreP (S9A serine peptidase family)